MTHPNFSWKWQTVSSKNILEYEVLDQVDEHEAGLFFKDMLQMVEDGTFFIIGNYGDQETNISAAKMAKLIEMAQKMNVHTYRCSIITSQNSYLIKTRLFNAVCASMNYDGEFHSTDNLAMARNWMYSQVEEPTRKSG
jgi:hypothetical protein